VTVLWLLTLTELTELKLGTAQVCDIGMVQREGVLG
jgi:hypothetical protein